MPNIDEHSDSDFIKMVYLGDSGAGKTGSLMSLAAAGYNLRIMDLDGGCQILKGYATTPVDKDGKANPYLNAKPGLWTEVQAKGIASRINYVTMQEKWTNIGGTPVPKGDLWNRIMAQLTEWKDGEKSFGKLESWTSSEVLIIDSLSRYCDARMNFELVMNGRATTGRQQQDYFKVQDNIERSLELLVSPAVKCHVILICHISYDEQDDKTVKGMPQAMGKALGPKIGQHFNHSLLARAQGQGVAETRKILTKTTGMIGLKNAAPLKVAGEYQLETGLAEYFQAILGPKK